MVQADIPQCHLCVLAAQGVPGDLEGLGVRPFRSVLAKTLLEILVLLFLLFRQGSQEHRPVPAQGSLEGLAGLAILGNLSGLALLSAQEPLGSLAPLFLPEVPCL